MKIRVTDQNGTPGTIHIPVKKSTRGRRPNSQQPPLSLKQQALYDILIRAHDPVTVASRYKLKESTITSMYRTSKKRILNRLTNRDAEQVIETYLGQVLQALTDNCPNRTSFTISRLQHTDPLTETHKKVKQRTKPMWVLREHSTQRYRGTFTKLISGLRSLLPLDTLQSLPTYWDLFNPLSYKLVDPKYSKRRNRYK